MRKIIWFSSIAAVLMAGTVYWAAHQPKSQRFIKRAVEWNPAYQLGQTIGAQFGRMTKSQSSYQCESTTEHVKASPKRPLPAQVIDTSRAATPTTSFVRGEQRWPCNSEFRCAQAATSESPVCRFEAEPTRQEQIDELMQQYGELRKQGKYHEAVMFAQRARELDPDDPVVDAALYTAQVIHQDDYATSQQVPVQVEECEDFCPMPLCQDEEEEAEDSGCWVCSVVQFWMAMFAEPKSGTEFAEPEPCTETCPEDGCTDYHCPGSSGGTETCPEDGCTDYHCPGSSGCPYAPCQKQCQTEECIEMPQEVPDECVPSEEDEYGNGIYGCEDECIQPAPQEEEEMLEPEDILDWQKESVPEEIVPHEPEAPDCRIDPQHHEEYPDCPFSGGCPPQEMEPVECEPLKPQPDEDSPMHHEIDTMEFRPSDAEEDEFDPFIF